MKTPQTRDRSKPTALKAKAPLFLALLSLCLALCFIPETAAVSTADGGDVTLAEEPLATEATDTVAENDVGTTEADTNAANDVTTDPPTDGETTETAADETSSDAGSDTQVPPQVEPDPLYRFDPETAELLLLSDDALLSDEWKEHLKTAQILTLAEGVTTIPAETFVFESDSPLLRLVLPASLSSVSENAFLRFPAAAAVYSYLDTEAYARTVPAPSGLGSATVHFSVRLTVLFRDANGDPFLASEPTTLRGFSGEAIEIVFPHPTFSYYTFHWEKESGAPTREQAYDESLRFVYPSTDSSLVFTAESFSFLAEYRIPTSLDLTVRTENEDKQERLAETIVFGESAGYEIPQKLGYSTYIWNDALSTYVSSTNTPEDLLLGGESNLLYVLYVADVYTLSLTYQYPNGQRRLDGQSLLVDSYTFIYGEELTFLPTPAENYKVDPDLLQSGFSAYTDENGALRIRFDGRIVGDTTVILHYAVEETRFFYACVSILLFVLLWTVFFLFYGIATRLRHAKGKRERDESPAPQKGPRGGTYI